MSNIRQDNRRRDPRVDRLAAARQVQSGAVGKTMTGSSEFTTWAALAGAAIGAGVCAIYSSSLWALIPAALVGAWLGYEGERNGRRWLERYLKQRGSR